MDTNMDTDIQTIDKNATVLMSVDGDAAVESKPQPQSTRYCRVLEQGGHIPGRVVIEHNSLRVAVEPKAGCQTCSGQGRMTMLISGYRVRTECPCVVRRFRAWQDKEPDNSDTKTPADTVKPAVDPVLDRDILTQIARLTAKLADLTAIEREAVEHIEEATAGIDLDMNAINEQITNINDAFNQHYRIIDKALNDLGQLETDFAEEKTKINTACQSEIDRLQNLIGKAKTEARDKIATLDQQFQDKHVEVDGKLAEFERADDEDYKPKKAALSQTLTQLECKKTEITKATMASVPVAEIRRTRRRIEKLQKRLSKRQERRARR